MSARRLGLLLIGAVFAVGGAANLWRGTYVAMPEWRRSIAWVAIGLGALFLVAALRRERSR